MKHWLALALGAGNVAAARAQQIPAGTVSLGGGIGYYQRHDSGSGISGGPNTSTIFSHRDLDRYFNAAPEAGYFVASNLAVGISAGYSTEYRRRDVTNDASSGVSSVNITDPATSYSVGVFGQYYRMVNAYFGFTGRLGADYLWQNTTGHDTNNGVGTTATYESTGTGYNLGLTPGLVFFPSPRIGLSASVGALQFAHRSSRSSDFGINPTTGDAFFVRTEETVNAFGSTFSFRSLLLGGAYYFRR